MVRDVWGSPDDLRIADVDAPPLTDDGVLVRVRATSVNAHDWHMLRGKPYIARLGEGLRRPTQRILGLDVAGVVEAVGPMVTDLHAGDRVFGSRLGAFAEYVVSKNMVPMPDLLAFEEAAAVPVAAQTALQGLRDRGGLTPGQRVLIVGAGGGVGTFAVQIARALGASVTAVTRAANLELMAELGADRAIDYAREDFTRGADRYDLVLDIGGTRMLRSLRRVLTPNGRIVMVAPGRGNWIGPIARIVGAVATSRFSSKRAVPFLSDVSRDDLLVLRQMLEAGTIRPVIARTYAFEEIPEAIRHMESGDVRGKLVISM